MKSTDLRIGNYLYYEHTTHIVSGIHGNKVYSWWVKDGEPVIEYEAKDISGTQVENPYMDVVSQYEPITLTEEWLEKFGSKLQRKNYSLNVGMELFDYSLFGDIVIYHHKVKGWTLTDMVRPNTYFFQYVHQLQNLYFGLTGEELKLK